MMTYFRVRNLGRFQHYKQRRPPWVKLYQTMLEDVELMRLQDASKWLAVGLLLVASRCDNRIPFDAEWVRRTLHMDNAPDLDALVSSGFIEICEDASNVLAERKHFARKFVAPSTEVRVQSTEKENSAALRVRAALPESDRPAFDRVISLAPFPPAFLAELEACTTGLNGLAATWAQVGAGLRDMATNGGPPTGLRLRAFVKSAQAETGRNGAGERQNPFAAIAKQLDAEEAARQ